MWFNFIEIIDKWYSGMRLPRKYHCWYWAILLLTAFSFSGCGGCRDDSANKSAEGKPDEELTEDGQKKKKPDFETKPIVLFPGNFKDEAKLNRFKLGHWSLANLRATANNTSVDGSILVVKENCAAVIGAGVWPRRPLTRAMSG